jgi:hypothetical protein
MHELTNVATFFNEPVAKFTTLSAFRKLLLQPARDGRAICGENSRRQIAAIFHPS